MRGNNRSCCSSRPSERFRERTNVRRCPIIGFSGAECDTSERSGFLPATMPPTHEILVGAALLLLLGVFASKASERLGVPALLLFLALGMLAGSDGPGGIHFDNAEVARFVGVIALSFILFAGGLDTEWSRVRVVLWEACSLSTLGVLATGAAVGLFAKHFLGFSLLEGLLLGAIISSTDAAAVFSVLRSRSMNLKDPVGPLLELESGSNDPMSVFLTAGLLILLGDPGVSWLGLVPRFFWNMGLGLAAGYGMGRLMTLLINRVKLGFEGLYPVLGIAFVLLSYGVSEWIGGNGFLAVYVSGLVMGNSRFLHKRRLLSSSDSLAWLMQITMFLVLGLLVFPSRLLPVAGAAIALSLFLMFVARPMGTWLALSLSRLSWRQKAMVSWVGLRGAVPIILATFPLLAGIRKADTIFNLVFFVVLTSALIQGPSIPLLARWLGLEAPLPPKPYHPLQFEPPANSASELIELTIAAGSKAAGKPLVDVGLPRGALAVLVGRGGTFLVPDGATVLQPGDQVLVLADKERASEVRAIVGSGSQTGS